MSSVKTLAISLKRDGSKNQYQLNSISQDITMILRTNMSSTQLVKTSLISLKRDGSKNPIEPFLEQKAL